MKIGIVTVYNSYNCGSFLQAYALYKTLKKNEVDVSFLKREPYRIGTFYYRFGKASKAFLKGHPIRALFIIREHFNFKSVQKILPKIDSLEGIDLVIYGSDTIWNIEAAYFKENWEKYWGKDVENKKITYAASVGSTDENAFYENPGFKKCINDFSDVSVRDEHTYSIALNLLESKKPVMVVDPTILLSVEEYDEIMGKCSRKDFILVYYFGKMTKKQKQAVEEFAKSQNKRIIYFGKNIPYSPKLMIAYYKAADYVITNTFHGNVFSILFNKKFISYGKEQKKVVDLLKEFGLSHRLLNNEDSITEILSAEINYDKINATLAEKRQQSLDFLNRHADRLGGEKIWEEQKP